MRAHYTITGILLTGLALAGCGSDDKGDSKPTPKAAASSASKSDQFLTAVKKANIDSWTDAGPTEDELLEYPEQWCTGLAEGHSVEYLFSTEGGMYPIGQEWGTRKTDARKVLVLGVTAYCPGYRQQVTQELRDTGQY